MIGQDEIKVWMSYISKMEKKIKNVETEVGKLKEERELLRRDTGQNDSKSKEQLQKMKERERQCSNKIKELEEKNRVLLEAVDQSQGQEKLQAIKTKELDMQKEAIRRQLRELQEEAGVLEDIYRREYLIDREIAELRTHNDEYLRSVKLLEQQISSMRREEEELIQKRSSELFDEKHQARLESELQDMRKELAVKSDNLQVFFQSLQDEEQSNLKMSKELEDLQARDKLHESLLEEATKGPRDEAVKLKKEIVIREAKFKENERANEELKRKVHRQEEELSQLTAKLRSLSSLPKSNPALKKVDRANLKVIESLVADKKELKTEVDRISREKGKLEEVSKMLDETLDIRKASIDTLIGKVSEVDMTDRDSTARILIAEDKPRPPQAARVSEAQLKRLVERVVIENIILNKRLKSLVSL